MATTVALPSSSSSLLARESPVIKRTPEEQAKLQELFGEGESEKDSSESEDSEPESQQLASPNPMPEPDCKEKLARVKQRLRQLYQEEEARKEQHKTKALDTIPSRSTKPRKADASPVKLQRTPQPGTAGRVLQAKRPVLATPKESNREKLAKAFKKLQRNNRAPNYRLFKG